MTSTRWPPGRAAGAMAHTSLKAAGPPFSQITTRKSEYAERARAVRQPLMSWAFRNPTKATATCISGPAAVREEAEHVRHSPETDPDQHAKRRQLLLNGLELGGPKHLW